MSMEHHDCVPVCAFTFCSRRVFLASWFVAETRLVRECEAVLNMYKCRLLIPKRILERRMKPDCERGRKSKRGNAAERVVKITSPLCYTREEEEEERRRSVMLCKHDKSPLAVPGRYA